MVAEKLQTELVETDVLCVGGGPAGLCAAIRARELGASVVVAEKSNTMRSGDAASGNDHFRCFIPEYHGDVDVVVKESAFGQWAKRRPVSFLKYFFENTTEMVHLWEEWGIPMKYEGRYEFAGHGHPGRPLIAMHYSGQNTKPVLTRQARKVGATIMNRVMIYDLLTHNGAVCGAVGVGVREPKLVVFKAKSVILGTGKVMRLHPGPTPGWLFNTNTSPFNTGDGRMMAYRAGCELNNIEVTGRWSGPKYFARNGKGTWRGVLRDPQGRPVGPFVTKPEKSGDITVDVYKTVFEEYARSGRGPVYMDLTGISEQDYKEMRHWLVHEGNMALLDQLEEDGVDLRERAIEFMTYGLLTFGGLYYGERGELSIPGLFAGGDEQQTFGMPGAAVFGRLAGESAANHSKVAETVEMKTQESKIEETKNLFEAILGREDGADWKETNIALQQVMNDYCGLVRSETVLTAGLAHLRRLNGKAFNSISASNQHELMRCLEVLNLLELGELVFITANERKESRGEHKRVDYPYTNPLLNDKQLTVKMVEGRPVVQWKDGASSVW